MNKKEFLSYLKCEIDSILGLNDLTEEQKKVVNIIYDTFIKVLSKSDFKIYEPFKYSINNDKDLLIFKRSEKRLTNIIINTDGFDTAFSYIPVSNKETRISYFIYEGEGTYEKLVYDFLNY